MQAPVLGSITFGGGHGLQATPGGQMHAPVFGSIIFGGGQGHAAAVVAGGHTHRPPAPTTIGGGHWTCAS